MASRVIPKQWVDPATGMLTQAAILFLNDLQYGSDNSIGTVTAGVRRAESKVDGVIDGTQVLATVTTADAGNLPGALAAQAATVNNVAAGSGFTVSLNRYSVTNNAPLLGAGTVTTQTVTATIFGGTGPFTQAWTYLSGASGFSANNDTSLTTDFDRAMADGEVANGTWQITVTDSLAATATADVAVNAYSTPLA